MQRLAIMKCKELMYGDWCCDKHGFPMRITNVGEDYAYADFEGNEADMWEFDDKLEPPYPIPLTDEILVKNGFKDYDEIKEYQFIENGEEYRFYLKKMYNKNGICDAWGTNIGGVLPSLISSVNELQQALRLAGLTEIANNFKV